MCFEITPYLQEKWTQTVAYKIVEARTRLSPYFGVEYKDGKTVECEVGPYERDGKAENGIYVCKTKADAYMLSALASFVLGNRGSTCRYYYMYIVIEVAVDPSDFLYNDNVNQYATYTKVKVIGEVP